MFVLIKLKKCGIGCWDVGEVILPVAIPALREPRIFRQIGHRRIDEVGQEQDAHLVHLLLAGDGRLVKVGHLGGKCPML